MTVVAEDSRDDQVKVTFRDEVTGVIKGRLPVADLLNLLTDLVAPEGDEKHNTFACLTLK